jgi:hypothetical protein
MLISKISNTLKRLKTSDLLYFEEQFMYGHREILLHYCMQKTRKLGSNMILRGSINHGFSYQENIWKMRKKNLRPAKRYVWNDRQLSPYGGASSVMATGAPWLYLLSDLGLNANNIEKRLKKDPKKVIIFPGHNVVSYFKYEITETIENYKSKIPQGSKVIVCLFWLDFCDPSIRKAFQDLGWEVVCMGYVPRLPKPDSTQGGRPNFLLELFTLFADASLLLTDNFSTGVLYALSLNLNVMYIESEQLVEVEKVGNEILGLVGPRSYGFFNSEKLWMKAYIPEILETDGKPKTFLNFALDELGYKNFLENIEGESFEWVKSEVDGKSLELYTEKFNSIKRFIDII